MEGFAWLKLRNTLDQAECRDGRGHLPPWVKLRSVILRFAHHAEDSEAVDRQ